MFDTILFNLNDLLSGMKVILIIFLVISMIVPAFKDDIQKKLPILLNIYLYTIPILLAYILIFLHKM